MKMVTWLTALLLVLSTDVLATCETESAAQVITVLRRGIELNEHFKQAANSRDETAYRTLRAEVEAYDETQAIPCVQRAQSLLIQRSNPDLLRRLMEFTVSHENSADESMSAAMAALYVRRPYDIETELQHFSFSQQATLLSSIDAGWELAAKPLSLSRRQNLRRRLNRLHETATAGETASRK